MRKIKMTNRTYNDLVSEVTEWLEGILKPGMDAHRYAVATIEECTPRDDNTIHFEVRHAQRQRQPRSRVV
jgi:hypothetical protein